MDDSTFVFGVVIVAAILFALDRLRLDFIALLVVLALTLGEILSPQEALAGFGDPVVILVCGLMVLGESLDRTGVAQAMGNAITDVGGKNRTALVTLIMLCTALLSSVMSSTAVVAIFIPIIFKIAGRTGIAASRLLLPMSFAAMISGMLTLIATMPNMVVSGKLESSGYEPLTFFGFAPVGVVVLAAAIVYMLVIGDRMLRSDTDDADSEPVRTLHQLWQDFAFHKRVETVRIAPDSPMCGKMVSECDLEPKYGVRILGISRASDHGLYGDLEDIGASDRLISGSQLLINGEPKGIGDFVEQERVTIVPRTDADRRHRLQERGGGVVMVHPDCRFKGKSVRQARLRTRYGVHVIGLQRDGQRIDDFVDEPLRAADMLLVSGTWKRISGLGKENHDFVLLELPAEHAEARPNFRRAPIAILALLAMVVASILGVMPITIAVIIAAIVVVAGRCLTAEDAYRSISWSSIVLLAGMLPVARALDKTGGTQMIVDAVVANVGGAGPYAMMAMLFVLTASMSLVLSNTATAVLLAPVAIKVAESMEVSPYPLAVTVLIGASSAFASPVASPVVTLVVDPGRYTFLDFVKIGAPLMVLAFIANLVVTPLIYPL